MKKLFLSLLFVVSAVVAHAQTEIQVQTHNVVALDEQFNVTFVVEGSKPSDFQWEPGSDFMLVWGPQKGSSTSISIINGKKTESSQTTFSYILRPIKAGRFTLPKAVAKVKGKEITSPEHQIEVVAQQKASSSSQQKSSPTTQQTVRNTRQQGVLSDEDLFMTLTLNRKDVVVGEPVTATVKLYQRVNISGFESASFPSFNGFWSQETEAPSNIEFARETYDGQIYNAATLRKFLLIPQKVGQLQIDPAELTCLVNIRVSSGGNSIFDGFFDDYRTVRKKVSTKPVTVNVAPLPAGAPASFGGGVGEFTISASLSKDSLKTHEAASLIVKVSGNGNVSLLEAPKVNFPPDVEVYDTKVVSNISKNGLSGTRKYEYPFIPRSSGEFVIEPVQYSYYDVNSKKYVTLQTQPIEMHVARGNEVESTVSGVIVPINQKDVKNLDSDIRYINTRNHSLTPKGQFFVGSSSFWTILSLLVMAAFAFWVGLRKISARKADVVGSKHRKATKMALKRLKLSNTFLRQNLYTAFYEELHKALVGFVSDKLNMPVAELSRDRIAEAMTARGVSEGYISKFIDILDACEFARYSPASGNDAMAAHYEAAVDVISSIDSNMKQNKNTARATAMLIALLMMPFAADAAEDVYVDSLWNAANEAYAQGLWTEAAEGYENIASMGLESAALYCNIGDAYFKDGNVPMAILYYERALKLDPSYADAQHNLELMNVRIQDRIEVVPEFFFKKWMKDICYLMGSDSWAVLFLVFFGLTLALLLMFLLAPGVGARRIGFFTGIVTLLFAVASLCFSVWQKNDYFNADEAIVMKPVISVKSSPSAEATKDLFILHEGTKVKIIDQVGEWNNIELSDGRQGWLKSSDVRRI